MVYCCCQAARGGSCMMRDLLSLLHASIWHANLFRASLRQCLRALIPPKRFRVDRGGAAEIGCQKPDGFLVSIQVLLVTTLKDEFHATMKINVKSNATNGVKWKEIGSFYLVFEWRNSKDRLGLRLLDWTLRCCECLHFVNFIFCQGFSLVVLPLYRMTLIFSSVCKGKPRKGSMSSSSLNLKTYPGACRHPLSLRHCHWTETDYFWKPALTWKQLPKIKNSPSSLLLIQWMGKWPPHSHIQSVSLERSKVSLDTNAYLQRLTPDETIVEFPATPTKTLKTTDKKNKSKGRSRD